MITIQDKVHRETKIFKDMTIVVSEKYPKKMIMKITILEILSETILIRNEDVASKPMIRMTIPDFSHRYEFVEQVF